MSYQTIAEKLEAFLKGSASTAYAEPQSDLHTQITKQAWARVKPQIPEGLVTSVLDVGCGSGLAIEMFTAEGYDVFAITCVPEEHEAVGNRLPYAAVALMDMHEIGYHVDGFDLIWMRHVAEHSPVPAFLLQEAHTALRDGGFLYLEVPNPDTACGHDTISNCNHYSVLGDRMWASLLIKAGFSVIDYFKFNFQVAAGPDSYTGFLVRKGKTTNK